MAVKLNKKNTKVQKVNKKAVVAAPKVTRQVNRAEVAEASVALPTGEFVEAIGRRKVATARVRLYKQSGDFVVNGKAAGQYFANISNSQVRYNLPFVLTETQNKYAVSAKISGSGINAQLEALIHGIAQALTTLDEANRPSLKEAGLLTRDDRMKETRKVGRGGKARRKRQSPKR